MFLRCKTCAQNGYRENDDELLRHDNKLRIWTRSGKFRKVENSELFKSWWQSTTRTPMTTSMLAWHGRQWHHLWLRGTARCVHHWPLPLNVSAFFFLSVSVVLSHIIRTRTVAQDVWVFSSPCASSSVRSLRLDSPFLFAALLSSPYILPSVPEVWGKPAQLRQRENGLHWRVLPLHRLWAQGPRLPRAQSSPTSSSWTRRRSSPRKSLLRTPTTMTLHSKTCSTKHIERKPFTLYEKTCLSVCRCRESPIERGDPLEIERRDPLSTEIQKHRFGLRSTITKSKFLQSAKQELINMNFKQLEPKKINNFFKDNYCSKIWNYVKFMKEVSLKWNS